MRVPSTDAAFIARVLDSGAFGIIAPHLESAEDARSIVRAVKYPPVGNRSLAGLLPQLHFRPLSAAETSQQLNEATMIIAMIESPAGLVAVEDIAAVDGVDILLVGTNDLCSALGVPGQVDHPLIRGAYQRCLEACRANRKVLGVGGLGSRPDLIKEFVALGARYVSTGNDLSFLVGAATQKRRQFA